MFEDLTKDVSKPDKKQNVKSQTSTHNQRDKAQLKNQPTRNITEAIDAKTTTIKRRKSIKNEEQLQQVEQKTTKSKSRKGDNNNDEDIEKVMIEKRNLRQQQKEQQEINLNREDEALIKHFMNICQEQNFRKAKLTKPKFRAFLTIRYKGVVADKITKFFMPFFYNPMDFDQFCDLFERFMNHYKEKFKRVMHTIYDFNDDKFIDELDVYCFYKTFEEDNHEFFMGVYLDDILKIIQQLHKKRKEKGFENRDMDLKLMKIKQKAARAGRIEKKDLGDLLKNALQNKKDPDEISFDRPDSGSGHNMEDDEKSEEDDDLLQELEDEEIERKTIREGKNNKSRRQSKSKDKDSQGSHKTYKTSKTAKTSKTTKTSKSRRSSKTLRGMGRQMSMRSGRSGRSTVKQDDESDEGQNPHSQVITTKFLKGFKKNNYYREKLAFSDFKDIAFEYGNFPRIAIDFFRYVTLFDIEQFYIQKENEKQNNQQVKKKDDFASQTLDEIESWKIILGDKMFKKVFRAFRCLSKNEEEIKEERVFLTENSFQNNLSRLFGYKNDYLATRLYCLMAGPERGKRIFFPQYMQTLNPLIRGTQESQQRFIFAFYDVDQDGVLNGFDIVQIFQNIVPSSIIGQEVDIVAKHYVETRLRQSVKRDIDIISIATFQRLVMRSCLIDELKQRLIAKPNSDWTLSVFASRDISFDKQAFELKKFIYGNMRIFKQKKHVQWKGLPPIEEDEIKQKKKIMKDAPQGVEDVNIAKQQEEEELRKIKLKQAKEEGLEYGNEDGEGELTYEENGLNTTEDKEKRENKIAKGIAKVYAGLNQKQKLSIVSTSKNPLKDQKAKLENKKKEENKGNLLQSLGTNLKKVTQKKKLIMIQQQ